MSRTHKSSRVQRWPRNGPTLDVSQLRFGASLTAAEDAGAGKGISRRRGPVPNVSPERAPEDETTALSWSADRCDIDGAAAPQKNSRAAPLPIS